MPVTLTFRPATGLKNPHLQTLWPALFRHDKRRAGHSERVLLADGDELRIDFGAAPCDNGQLVVILHGITGSSDSPYIRGLQSRLDQLGIASAAINARGHGGHQSNSVKLTSAGETDDIHQALTHCIERHRIQEMVLIGFSLGGCRLLNYLAEGRAHPSLVAAATVCVPFDLSATSNRVESGFSKIYRFQLIQELRGLMASRIDHLSTHAPQRAEQLKALGPVPMAASFRDYSEQVMAPLYGFRDAEHYFQTFSPRPRLAAIQVPTLMLQAQDDPLMLPESLPQPSGLPRHVTLEVTRHGGHVGYVAGSALQPRYWLDDRLAAFVGQHFPLSGALQAAFG